MQPKSEIMEQRGFTLIELLVVIGILAFLAVITTMAFSLMTTVSLRSAADNIMLSQVHLAGNWITRDVERAKTVTPGTSPTVCTLICYIWNGTDNITDNTNIVYAIATDTYGVSWLTRKVNTGTAQQIAQYISSANLTQLTPLSNYMYQDNITATYNNFSLNRVYKAEQRYPQ